MCVVALPTSDNTCVIVEADRLAGLLLTALD